MKIENFRVMLYVNDDYYGDLTSMEQQVDEEEFSGWVGEPVIFKTWKSSSIWEFKMPGLELAVRKFLHATLSEKKTYKIMVDSDDILVAMLYPYEDKKLYVRAYDLVVAAKIPHTVYNEDTVMFGAGGSFSVLANNSETAEQERLLELLPGLNDEITCPHVGCEEDNGVTYRETLWHVIQHLNDSHEWTREDIADWLETLDTDITFPIGEANGK